MQQQVSGQARAGSNRRRFRWNATRRFSRSSANCRASSTARSIATAPIRSSKHQARTGLSATACCTPSISKMAAPVTATAGSAPRNGRPSMTPAARCSAASAASCRMRRPSTSQDSGVANTNIIFHGGRLLALEEGHLPTEIEPGTLERRGYCNYDGGIAGPFTAHPKIDPVTGEMVFFGYNAAGPFTPALSFGSVNASGAVTRFDRFEAPYASMVHDFIVTENHLLFPVLPITGSMERAMSGRPALCLGAGQGRLCRRHEAQWYCQATSSGFAPKTATSSMS